ncbi:MAG: YdcF family protein [Anaerolineales bacterium]|nr:YdcF family protein [Anaerolineales bacterium]
MFVEWIKDYFVPGSVTFLLLGMSVGVVLLFRGKRASKWGRVILAGLAISYWLLATPFCATILEAWLRDGFSPLENVSQLDANAVLILGGGSVTQSIGEDEINTLSGTSAMRVLEALRLYEQMDEPLVIVSGGINERVGRMTPESYPMRSALISGGVPEDRILMESGSQNTYEQALYLAPLFEEYDVGTFILVTSESHMRRSLAVFQGHGFHPIPSAAPQHGEGQVVSRWGLLPNEEALDASRNAVREIMAIIYYSLSGKFQP